MSDSKDFIIENGVLKKYVGPGGDVVIPEGVTTIDAFAFEFCRDLKSVTVLASVVVFGYEAFRFCRRLTRVSIMGNARIADSEYNRVFKQCESITEVFAPATSHSVWREQGLGMAAAETFLKRYSEYGDPGVKKEYIDYISSQRKKLLPLVFRSDTVEIIQMLAEAKKITYKNLDQDYLLSAQKCKAQKCIVFLESMRGKSPGGKRITPENTSENVLWDGIHFSLDGKKLMKSPEFVGQTVFRVPEGTKEISKTAFAPTELTAIYLPDSVTTIRSNAFFAGKSRTLFVHLPASSTPWSFLNRWLPQTAFSSRFFDEKAKRWCAENNTYYISSADKEIAGELCMDSSSRGNRRMVYTGGPLDDLPYQFRHHAVEGFLYASEHGLEDLSAWKDSYFDHIKRNEKTYLRQAVKNEYLFRLMLEESLLSPEGVKQLLRSFGQRHPERKAALLEYQNAYSGGKRRKDDLTLSENDPEFKRKLKMADRREQIRDQKGIRGLVFVSTGRLDHFGNIDEFTNEHDFSDLKDYIESRGGRYRSAVSSKTDYLICNDLNSDSVKSRKARELGVPVITEEEFLKMAKETQ